jgi:hypothetical protein
MRFGSFTEGTEGCATKKRHYRSVAAILIACHGFWFPFVPRAQQIVASSDKVYSFVIISI